MVALKQRIFVGHLERAGSGYNVKIRVLAKIVRNTSSL